MAIPFRQIRDELSTARFPNSELDGSRAERTDTPFPIGNVDDEVAREASAQAPWIRLRSISIPELSLLQFQRRVLEEVRDSRNPLLERVKFLAILSSNLDEFFMVRVAGLLQQIESGVETLSIDGRAPGSQLEAIRTECIRFDSRCVYCLSSDALLPELACSRHHDCRLPLPEFRPTSAPATLFPGEYLPRAYAVGLRSWPPLSTHFEFEPQSGRRRTG